MATLPGHGMEPQEEAIMDLWDEGLSPAQIARDLDLSPARVRSVTKTFSDNRSDLWAIHARRATGELARALAGATA